MVNLVHHDGDFLSERSKQNKHVVCHKDNDVNNGVDNDVEDGDDDSFEDGDDDSVDNGDKSADKHLKHLSQAADFCFTKRSKQNKHLVCDNDNDVDDNVDNGDDDSVDNGDDDGVDNGDD
eukprot:3242406-Ditylum_brightwellii.AAC.1